MEPITPDHFNARVAQMGLSGGIEHATIRQISALAQTLERDCGEAFVHLEIGNPGLPPSPMGVDAQCAALRGGIAAVYPDIKGCDAIKEAGHRFVRAFFDVDIPGRCIVPTVGSMQGSFTLFTLFGHLEPGRDTVLFINPGFSAQRNQVRYLGLKERGFDIYEYRGDALEGKLDQMMADGRVVAVVYSTPNNPAWINLTDDELHAIGRAADRHGVVVVEDHAYAGMDFRTYLGHPGEAPFIPTVARYAKRYVMMISASKIFSYAGERIAIMAFGPGFADERPAELCKFFGMPTVLDCYIYGVLYAASSGTSHSAQLAMAAMLSAAASGELDFVDDCSAYRERSARARRMFADAGFELVYATDADGRAISDGFFFTASRPGWTGTDLQTALLRHGIATMSLPSTGSERQGLRICVSRLADERQFNLLAQRLKSFVDEYQQEASQTPRQEVAAMQC